MGDRRRRDLEKIGEKGENGGERGRVEETLMEWRWRRNGKECV